MNNLLSLLSVVIGNPGRNVRKENEHLFFCPECNHYKPKLQVNTQTQKWHCWVCNIRGRTLKQLFYKLKATPTQFVELNDILGETLYIPTGGKNPTVQIVELPKEYKPLWTTNGSDIIKKHSLSFLKRRNVSFGDIVKYQIGYCDDGIYSNRVIVPSYDLTGKLNFFVGRNIYSGGMKYKNPPYSKDVIIFENQINWNEPIVLCEGAFDAIAIKRNSIPLMGKTIPNTLMKKIIDENVKNIYIALDADAIQSTIKISETFSKFDINVFIIKFNNDDDPSEVGFLKMNQLLKDSTKLNFSDRVLMKLNNI
jgi:hypothetical protein